MRTDGKGYTVSSRDASIRHYDSDTVVISEETPDDGSIFILNKGKLVVLKEGKPLSEITEPGVFGEMATVLNTTRTATIKTVAECTITVYTGGLHRIIEQVPSVALKIMISLAKRLERQTILHTDDLIRLENLEKLGQQLRKQVVGLKEEVEELKAAPGAQAATSSKKSAGLFGRRK